MPLARVELTLAPNRELLTAVRRFAIDLYGRVLGNGDLADRLGLATHELFENAIKYSESTQSLIGVLIADSDDVVRVQTTNEARPQDASQVRTIIDSLTAAPNKLLTYTRMVKESAQRSVGSGLGLARICAEGGFSLSYEIEGTRVRISAEAKLK